MLPLVKSCHSLLYQNPIVYYYNLRLLTQGYTDTLLRPLPMLSQWKWYQNTSLMHLLTLNGWYTDKNNYHLSASIAPCIQTISPSLPVCVVCTESQISPPNSVCTECTSHDSLHPAMLHGVTVMLYTVSGWMGSPQMMWCLSVWNCRVWLLAQWNEKTLQH